MFQQRIDQYFENRENELVDTISRLIAVRSVREDPLPGMPFGNGPAEALALSLSIASDLGFMTANHENYVGTVDLNNQETRLGILCHLDVVGEGSGWEHAAVFSGKQEGMLYGRGASDDKGRLVASLFALKAVKDLEIPLKFNARLILGTDEETNSADIEYYFERHATPPFTFCPMALFRSSTPRKAASSPHSQRPGLFLPNFPASPQSKAAFASIVVRPRLKPGWKA